MRRLMWFTVGFAAACCVGAYLPLGKWILALCGLALAAGFCLRISCRNKQWGRGMAVAFLGCFVGALWWFGMEWLYLAPVRSYDETEITGTIQVVDYSEETDYGASVDGKITLNGKRYKVRVYTEGNCMASPGDTLQGTFRIRLTAPGGARESVYYQGEGTFLLAYARDVRLLSGDGKGLSLFPARLRRQIVNLLDSAFPEDTRGFAVALLLGDDRGIDYATDTALKLSGIRHVIAVSGLHVSILFSFVYTAVGKRRWLTAIIGIPVLLLFAAAAGFTPSIIRAVVMQMLMILAMLVNKEYDPPTALAAAVLTMLAVNPYSVQSVSLQLSAGCMAGMFLLSGRISGYLLTEKCLGTGKGRSLKAKITRWLAGSVSVSVSTMAVTAPLSAMYFGTVSMIGILTNLLTLWAVTLIFYGVIAVCVVAVVFLPGGKILGWLISWLIRYVTSVAGLLSKVPAAAVYTDSIYVVLWLAFAYVLIILFLVGDRKRGGLLALCIAGSLVLSVGVTWAEARLERCRVTVLDVGQGQSVLFQRKGCYYLVDCGGSVDTRAADAAAQALLSQGVSRLDGLILTHYDLDHAGGAELLLSRIQVDTIYLPDISRDNDLRARLADAHSDRIQWITENTVISEELLSISLFPGENTANDNESSLCVLFQTENCDILITGDRNQTGERYLLEQTELPEVELLVAGHHGAASSTGFELLGAVRPKAVAISVGEGNAYGHPHSDVLRRLEIFGCEVYRTDENGTIVFRG